MSYSENKQTFQALADKRKYLLEEITRPNFWIQDDGNEVKLLEQTASKSIRIENPTREVVAFIPMDGKTGMFKNSPPPVKDEAPFKYRWFTNDRYEERTAGACDCLLLDGKWRFFELKTEVFTQNENQAAQTREKAMLQLARTITFFKEQAEAQRVEIDSPIEAVMAFPSRFPAEKAVGFNRGPRFFKLFKARLEEVKTDVAYVLR